MYGNASLQNLSVLQCLMNTYKFLRYIHQNDTNVTQDSHIIIRLSVWQPLHVGECHLNHASHFLRTSFQTEHSRHNNSKALVLGLGRVFRLECLPMTEFRAQLQLGTREFHLKACMFYMGKYRFSLGSNHIGSTFQHSHLLFDIYNIFNQQLIHDIQQILPKLHKF